VGLTPQLSLGGQARHIELNVFVSHEVKYFKFFSLSFYLEKAPEFVHGRAKMTNLFKKHAFFQIIYEKFSRIDVTVFLSTLPACLTSGLNEGFVMIK
jgi:hypothetical protein